MKTVAFARRAFGASLAAGVLAGCSASPSQPQMVPAVLAGAHARSWMLPEASSETLLYYSDGGGNVYALSYPQGKLVGTLTGFDGSQGVCSDANGDVFITTLYTEDIFEYAHGGTEPIAKLGDYGYYPLGCAVDPVTGNLAVANTQAMNGGDGNVAIYTGAKGKPTDYTASGLFGYSWCAYDGSGNLYVNGGNALAEMPYGSQSLDEISLSVTGDAIQWDGQYLAMINPTAKVVYRIAISGSSGTVTSTVDFTGLFAELGDDFVLPTGAIVMPFGVKQNRITRIGQWNYPKGGTVKKTIHRVEYVEALALSI